MLSGFELYPRWVPLQTMNDSKMQTNKCHYAWHLILAPDVNVFNKSCGFVYQTHVSHCSLRCSRTELSEFIYSTRRLKPKELSLFDFPRTKIFPFWLTENTIIGPIFGLPNAQEWHHVSSPFGLTYRVKINCHAYLWIRSLPRQVWRK